MDARVGLYKKAERRRIDAFELWCWRRLLRVPWTARRSNQSILKEISPEYSVEGLMLKLKLHSLATWCKELTHWKRPWCWERLNAGGEGDDKGGDGWMASPTRCTWVWVSSGSWWWTGKPRVLQSMDYKESDTAEWLNWTELNFHLIGDHNCFLKISCLSFLSLSFLLETPPTQTYEWSLPWTLSANHHSLLCVPRETYTPGALTWWTLHCRHQLFSQFVGRCSNTC